MYTKKTHGSRIVEHYRFYYHFADNPPRESQDIDKEYLYHKKLTPGSESYAGSSPESAVHELWYQYMSCDTWKTRNYRYDSQQPSSKVV